jgi:hypothetical protein
MKPIELRFHFAVFSSFFPLSPVEFSRFNVLTIQRFNALLASPTESNQIQPPPPPPVKESVKKTACPAEALLAEEGKEFGYF